MSLFPQHRRLVRYGSVVALAVLYTLLNVPKPLQVDDTAYFYFARQFAEDPAHPYDFKVFWYSRPHPAIEILAPPVLPAWWSLAYRVAPESPWVWKLWLFPFSLLFVGALDVLFRRFCPGQAPPLLWMTVLSPTFLPSLNLMLDVPALALSLTSLVLFLKACPRRDQPPPETAAERNYRMFVPPLKAWFFAGAAGLVAGVAMQTKYTGVVAPAAIVLAGLFFRRPTLPIFAGLLATGVFVGSEYWIYLQHGQSHFIANLPGPDPNYWQTKWVFFCLLATIIGGLTPAVTLIGLRTLGLRHLLWIPRVLFVGIFITIASVDSNAVWDALGDWRDVTPVREWMATFEYKTERWVFAPAGLLLAAVLTAVAGRLCFPWRLQRDPPAEPSWTIGLGSAASWFLVCWLLLELVAYVALTPFGAVRRVMGLVVVSTLCVGRLAARTCRTPAARIDLIATAGFGVLLGFLFYKVDLDDANAHRAGAEGAAQWIRQQDPHPTIWFVGHWGFQYYAEHAGMQAVEPGASVLAEGDWLVVPEGRLHQQLLKLKPDEYDLRLMFDVKDVSGIPTDDKNRVIVAEVNGLLHFRIFDVAGQMVVDTDENRLPAQAGPINELREKLKNLRPLQELKGSEEAEFVNTISSIVGYTQPDWVEARRVVVVPQGLPLRTVQTFYGGYHAIEHHSGPRLSVTVYRVTASHQTRPRP